MKLFLLLGVTSQRPKFNIFGYVEIGVFTTLKMSYMTKAQFPTLNEL